MPRGQPLLNIRPARAEPRSISYHGDAVADPYRWLEDLDADETRAWIEAQNRLAQPYLESYAARTRGSRVA